MSDGLKSRYRSFPWITALFCLAVVDLAASALVRAQAGERGTRPVLRAVDEASFGFSGNYALLIGVSRYTGWAPLLTIPSELDDVGKALIEQGFEITRVDDPNAEELNDAFEDFIDDYGYKEDHRLFFFFAGHGYSDDKGNGYLIPADAPEKDSLEGSEIKLRRHALSMRKFEFWATDIEARHALFVFDSCFSGAIFTDRSSGDDARYMRDQSALPIRYFITAGSARQTVPSRSFFTPTFIQAIQGKGDTDGDGYVTGRELRKYLKKHFRANNQEEIPQAGTLQEVDAKFAQGDFVFPVSSRLAEKKLAERIDKALVAARDQIGDVIDGSQYDRIKQLLRENGDRERQETLLDFLENLGNGRMSQYALKGFLDEQGLRARSEGNGLATASLRPETRPAKTPAVVDRSVVDSRRMKTTPPPPPPPPVEPEKVDPVLHVEEKIAMLAEAERGPALFEFLESIESELDLENSRTLGASAWAIDFIGGRSRLTAERARAKEWRERIFADLRRSRPPPSLEGSWIAVPAGVLAMGDEFGMAIEKPVHAVELAAFRMLDHEVTNAEFRLFSPSHAGEDDLPATGISWYTAYAYAAWIGGRLPTEAEWEYAATAECPFKLCAFGGVETTLDELAWWKLNSGAKLQPVRRKQPNALGLHDLLGNAREWIADWHGTYPADRQTAPGGPAGGDRRVRRGGSARDYDTILRPTRRDHAAADETDRFTGFRIVMPNPKT